MFRRVLSLIVGLAQSMIGLDPEKLRAAILAALRALQVSAAATPGFLDDLILKAAIMFVESDAWNLILQKLIGVGVVVTVPPGVASAVMVAGDLDALLADDFAAIEGSIV